MAVISFDELLLVVKAAAGYKEKWELDVPAEQALYIRFSKERVEVVDSDVLEIIDGSELVLKTGRDGRIVGIEIM